MIIPRDIIDEVRSKVDIVDIIGERVRLKKTGANYKGLCPFHNEKTPSFVVNQDKQIFKCFGCSAGGDVIGFVERADGLSFFEAVKKLADYAGVRIPEQKQISPALKQIHDRKQELIDVNLMAREYFVKTLKIAGSKAYNYAKERRLSEETLSAFYIGSADSSWDGLATFLNSKVGEMSKPVSLGLIKEKNGKYYDTFRDRLMFPIMNHRGEVLAFGGRIIEANPDSPKYINSKESEIYKKGEVLFGLYQTAKYIREQGFAVVVEGYMDFLSLYQAGIKNVIATLGTSFTEKQVLLLRRYTDRVVLFYDTDKAGIEAAKRSLVPLLENGFKVDALFLEEGMDPDDAVKKIGSDELYKRLWSAKPLMHRIISDRFTQSAGMSDKPKLVSEILAYIGLMPNSVERVFWLQELSLRTGIPGKQLSELLRSYIKSSTKQDLSPVKNNSAIFAKIPPIYKNTIRSIFVMPDLLANVFDEEWDIYMPADLRSLLFGLRELFISKGVLDITDWLYLAKNSGFMWIESFLAKEFINTKDKDGIEKIEELFYGCMIQFKIASLQKKCKDSLAQMNNIEQSEKSLREYSEIILEIKQLKETLLGLMK